MTSPVVDLGALKLPRSVPAGIFVADGAAFNGPCQLYGWSIAETTGAATASLNLRDGGDANSPKIALVNLLAAESTRDWFSGPGLWCQTGVFVDWISGSIDLTLYLVRQ